MLGAALAAISAGTSIASMLRKQPTYGYSKGDLDYLAAQRSNQIDAFSKQLADLRARYSSSLANFGNNTFSRFAPNAEAMYASRGLQVTGGAFQSALAKKAAEIQDEEGVNLLNLENSDLKYVDNARGNILAAQMGAHPSGPSQDPTSVGLGQLGAATGDLALSMYNPTPTSGVNNQALGNGVNNPANFRTAAQVNGPLQIPRRSVFSNPMYLSYR